VVCCYCCRLFIVVHCYCYCRLSIFARCYHRSLLLLL
jgi:hypothetical protein